MGIFDKVFGSANDNSKSNTPRNVKLVTLLNRFASDSTTENYQAVVNELQIGQSFLIIPSVNDGESKSSEWHIHSGKTLKLTSVIDLQGIRTLLVFSDEEAMLEWSQKPADYKSIVSKDLLEFCMGTDIYRIVININQRNMFLVDREVPVTTEKISAPVKVRLGAPANPLPNAIIGDLVNGFQAIEEIEEAFQYLQSREDVPEHMIGFSLNNKSETATKAVLACVNEVMQRHKPDKRIGIYFIQSDNVYQTIKNIPNALFYSR